VGRPSSGAVRVLGVRSYRKKEYPYLLVTILGDPIAYRGGIINLKIGPI